MKSLNVGLCGVGTVGAGTLRLLADNAGLIAARSGRGLKVTHVGARRAVDGALIGTARVSNDIFAIARDPAIDILVETIGGCGVARELVEIALAQGKHVVTANKALIAEHGNELLALARDRGVQLRYEAAVGGGIPIIKALREGLAGNRIGTVAGVINGTSNFILTGMRDQGREFGDVLAEAQALGYAEADPTFDVEGIDAAHKLCILAAIAFDTPMRYSEVFCEGISALTPSDIGYAAELGYRIKHVALACRSERGIELRVHPTLLPTGSLLANVDGVQNAVLVCGDAVGSTLYAGPGAGAGPTASAVVSDLMDLARGLSCDPVAPGSDAGEAPPVVPIEDVASAWYLRLSAEDRPGVLSRIATLLSDVGVSVEALIQKAPAAGMARATLIVLTNRASQRDLFAALDRIEALDTVASRVVRIRVEDPGA